MYEFKLPDLGEGIHEGELLKWYVGEGDEISEDDDLMDVETDKAAVTVPAPVSGTVARLNGEVGDILHVGDVVVVVDDGSGGEVAEQAPAAERAESPPAEKPAAEVEEEPPAEPAPAEREEEPARAEPDGAKPDAAERPAGRPVPAAPATRRIARELGVDINLVPGTGPGGRVTREDVEAFAKGERKPTAEEEEAAEVATGELSGIPFLSVEELPEFERFGPVEREPIRSIRRKVAKKMVTSMVLVPHVAHMDEADVSELEAFRRRERKRRDGGPGEKLTLLPFVMRALVSLLRRYPQFNASLDPHRHEIVYKKYYNIGFAADTPRGLVVPVVNDVDRKSIVQVSEEIVALALKARDGEIDASELRGGTFTITNVGPIGGTGLIPTINYPEVGILGMGRAQQKPVVRGGEVVVRTMLPLTLAFDHRVADGAQAAHMMTELSRLLADPNQLLLEA